MIPLAERARSMRGAVSLWHAQISGRGSSRLTVLNGLSIHELDLRNDPLDHSNEMKNS